LILWEKETEEREKTRPITKAMKIGLTLDGKYRLMPQLL